AKSQSRADLGRVENSWRAIERRNRVWRPVSQERLRGGARPAWCYTGYAVLLVQIQNEEDLHSAHPDKANRKNCQYSLIRGHCTRFGQIQLVLSLIPLFLSFLKFLLLFLKTR